MLPSTLFAAVIVGTFESSLGYLAKYRMHKSEESEPAAEKNETKYFIVSWVISSYLDEERCWRLQATV